MSGTIVIIKPGETATALHESRRWNKAGQPDYGVLREVIGGGWIELIKVKYDGRLRDAFVDEEGLLKKQAPNDAATIMCVNRHFIVGIMAVWIPDAKKQKAPSRINQIVDVS